MTAPLLAAQRFSYAFLTGVVLGFVYGFLRPLRPKYTALSDFLFLAVLLYGWLFLHFRLCQADIRMAYHAAMLLGGFAWELSIGRLLRPVFGTFWNMLYKIWGFLLLPFKKFSKMSKILLASGQKWVTIYWCNHRHYLSKFGGKNHGELQNKG